MTDIEQETAPKIASLDISDEIDQSPEKFLDSREYSSSEVEKEVPKGIIEMTTAVTEPTPKNAVLQRRISPENTVEGEDSPSCSGSEDEEDADLEKAALQTPSTNPSKIIYTLKELRKKDNLFFVKRDYIRYGYRAHENMTFGMCTKTVCQVHNETGNVFTHLLPGIYFLI